ncbi:MAG: hypothetical protein ACX930_10870 [Erythrobacter sp.]
MVIAIRVVLSLLGLLFVFMGAGFLIDPVGSGGNFGLEAAGPQGLASIRGDMTAFFWVAGASAIVGAWRGDRSLLYVAAALMGIVFMGRALGALLDGTYDGWYVPMAVEGLTVAVALIATRVVAKPQ